MKYFKRLFFYLTSPKHIIGLGARVSSYLLLLSLFVTFLAKALSIIRMETGEDWWQHLLYVVPLDIATLFGLMTLLLLIEVNAGKLRFISPFLAFFIFILNATNAAYLLIAGQQLNFEILLVGIDRFRDAWGIFINLLPRFNLLVIFFVIVCVIVLHIVLRRWVNKYHRPSNITLFRNVFGDRAHISFMYMIFGLLLFLFLPTPNAFSVRMLSSNFIIDTYLGFTNNQPEAYQDRSTSFNGFQPLKLVTQESVEGLANSWRPNIVMLVMESTRYDHVEMPNHENGPDSRPSTPNLLRLAEKGTWATNARAAVPHTSKSLFSMMCGRLPLLHKENFELLPFFDMECLPSVLSNAGYRTSFFQSAIGIFENRPRMVKKLGFQHFEAWENVGGEPLGYVASNDLILAAPFEKWLDEEANGQPFFSVLLTSATHHPYIIPQNEFNTGGRDNEELSAQQRYGRIIGLKDKLLGIVLDALDERDLRSSTVVIVVGDHGEGFGGKGVMQHDNNFFEEGLHVPFVMNGPGVPRMRIDANMSLIDTAPTIFEILNLKKTEFNESQLLFGESIYKKNRAHKPAFFACWYDNICAGLVVDNRKVVYLPYNGMAFYYDLEKDPNELTPQDITPDLGGKIHEIKSTMMAMRFTQNSKPDDMNFAEELRIYDGWICPEYGLCQHPNSPANYFHAPPQSFYTPRYD